MAFLTFLDDGAGRKDYNSVYGAEDAAVCAATSRYLYVNALNCSGDLVVFCSGAATIELNTVACQTLTLFVGHAATVRINGGNIQKIQGSVTHASTCVNKADTKSDSVTKDSDSTYIHN